MAKALSLALRAKWSMAVPAYIRCSAKPMRAAIGGGKAVIGSNVKVAAPGATLDVPLGYKDEAWSFAHFDTVTVSLADSPRPYEILVAMVIADGGRLDNRCGTDPIR